jgi:hypothetical protein
MKQAAEYRQLAEECRKLAQGARRDEERRQLLLFAQAWKHLAENRERQLALAIGEPNLPLHQ